jgi:hypothetical protein
LRAGDAALVEVVDGIRSTDGVVPGGQQVRFVADGDNASSMNGWRWQGSVRRPARAGLWLIG